MKAIVIFASLTGNNEEIAEYLTKQLRDHAIDTKMTEMSQTDAADLGGYDIVLMAPYTYGEGDLPEAGLDLYDDLADTVMPNVVFGVAGSGDSWYKEDFCKAVILFDQRLAETGAHRGSQPVLIDLRMEADDEGRLTAFVADILATVSKVS